MSKELIVYVICCNDSTEFAIIGNKAKAEIKMTELCKAYFEKTKGRFKDFEEYRSRCYWNIREIMGAYE